MAKSKGPSPKLPHDRGKDSHVAPSIQRAHAITRKAVGGLKGNIAKPAMPAKMGKAAGTPKKYRAD